MRRRPALAGLACLLALTQASAKEVLTAPRNPVKPHATRAKTAGAPRPAGLAAISFSDPYGSPVGVSKGKGAGFPPSETTVPVQPQGGFTIKAGRDSPDAPMTGGLMFRF
ncbi:hypothetical protein DFR50_11416 [Roseiarcus fermentans]|uniref:Uncharacterized protein n=1 Tax=Roseiarcus fermentans TaxID=1473586 RepID=A0A366FC56_9HYPH|nr:hypothetical protein [Roseiarcus fermentans]RBP12187.1 hypothetical protein DFR50_11416 [Roseiarcus fermentans]